MAYVIEYHTVRLHGKEYHGVVQYMGGQELYRGGRMPDMEGDDAGYGRVVVGHGCLQ